jgi:bifunctional DNA-binding transcriptional regulator/antitoxin component of YhaV-PrlF toxin-antitoxin module
MKRKDLEYFLERGDELGFIKKTDDDSYLGWILLRKRKPNERYESLLELGEDPDFIAKQDLIRSKPYRITLLELRREVHESDKYEINEDYRLREKYDFSSLDEVEIFLEKFNYNLEDIKWRIEIDAP